MPSGTKWLVAVAGFMLLEVGIFLYVDRPLSAYLRIIDTTHPSLIDFFRAYTDLGKSKWYLWPSGLGVLFCSARLRYPLITIQKAQHLKAIGEHLAFFFTTIAVSGITADIIKAILGRARPIELANDNIYGFTFFVFNHHYNSMPSGHTTTAFALAGTLALFFPRGTPLWFSFATAIALSRVMVNAHFLSDVVAGAMVGLLTVYLLHKARKGQWINPIYRRLFPIDTKPPSP